MKQNSRDIFVRTKIATAVGFAIFALANTSQAAYEARNPVLGNTDNVSNVEASKSVNVDVLANDGVTADANTLNIGRPPTKGTAVVSGDEIIYTPNPDYSGTDSFTYTVSEVEWRTSNSAPGNLGLTANPPVASSYADGAASTPIHNGTPGGVSGFWNLAPLANGVVGKSFHPNATSFPLQGCNESDTDAGNINLTVVWKAQREGTVSNGGNMFTITSDAAPTPLGDSEGIVLKSDRDSSKDIARNGSGIVDINGAIYQNDTPFWKFEATGNWVGLTQAQFETMDVTILASTVNGKLWNVQDVAFTAETDLSKCSLKTATVTVNVSDTVVAVEPGDPNNLDEDNDGIPDVIEGSEDADGDGIADYLDLDSDNDSIPDIIEAGGTDLDANGQVDEGSNFTNTSPTDTDGDGTPDSQEVDSNGNGTYDIASTSAADTDADGDGKRDNIVDENGDGLDDSLVGSAVILTDTDGNGTPDYAEPAKISSGGGGGGVINTFTMLALSLFGLASIRRRQK